ncbi:MAG TPA: AAA family ATPase [Kofleriaceae bacterium]|nr:AAA family ATPase [Kofleriaceae bacterium]
MGECLSANDIQELVAGRLAGDPLAQAHLHIEACTECRTLVIELARDSDLESISAADTMHATPEGGPPLRGAARAAERAVAERFEIVRPLGRGGMGVVYEAIERARGARVALKTLQHVSADGLLRFKTEFRALQDVQHPNLVTFGELIEDGGRWWLTMELVEGAALLDHVRPGGRLDEGRLRAALAQLGAALHALHAHGLVHRDIKPHNVRVTPAGRVVLLDFGLVAGVAQSESNVVGTPAYMAPEQAMLEEVGPAADWYGVGALLYEALTGALPFEGAPLQVLLAKQHAAPRRPGELAPVPEDLEALCLQLLAVSPAPRLAAAAALTGLGAGAGAGAATAPRSSAVTAVPPSSPSSPSSSSSFVGRRRELAGLADAFAAAGAGAGAGAETIVLVQGESGIGKSALVERFVDELRGAAADAVVLAGRCYERETVPYKGVDGIVDALARYLRKLPDAEAAAVLPRRAGLLVQAFPVLGKVPALGKLPADDVIDPLELRMRAFTALRELLGRLAERRPLVVWIDDLQWADADSLELLAWVMAPPEAPPLLLVLTSRPPREAGDGDSAAAALARVRALPGLRLLELRPLPRDEAVALAEQLLAGDAARAAALADEAAGHPLFLDALVRHTAGRSAAGAPLRLSDALWARIAELDPAARQLLALTAIAGWPLPSEILTAASGLSADELDPALARLRHAHLVRAADRSRKGAVEPYHDRVREAVLEHLEAEPRRACHRALAQALLAVTPSPAPSAPSTPSAPSASDAWWGPEAVGVHLHAAGDLEQAAGYLRLAADQAAAALAFDRAARLYRQALDLHEQSGAALGPLGEPREILARLARALVNARHGADAAVVYFELARRAQAAGEDDLELRLRGAEQLLRSGHQEDGRQAFTRVLDELDLSPPATRAGMLLRLLWRRAWVRLRGFGALDPARQRAPAEPSPRERLRLEACRVASLTIELVTPELSAEYFTRYQVLALKTSEPGYLGVALGTEITIAILVGGAGERRVARLQEQLAAAAERSGDPYLLGLQANVCALREVALGQWARGREHGARAVQLYRERCFGASCETALAAIYYYLCLLNMGELRDLVRELPADLREAEERKDLFTQATLHSGATSLLALVLDQPEVARQYVARGRAFWPDARSDHRGLTTRLSYTEISLYEGEGAAAYRHIDPDLRRILALPFFRLAFVRARTLYLHGVAALAVYRSGERDRKLLRAAARDARWLRAMRMPWTYAFARVLDAGIALATGAPAEAREQLARAASELEAAGMMLLATVARRRVGELDGGAAGARAVAEADAWLAAQEVRAPERLARVFMPEVAALRLLPA